MGRETHKDNSYKPGDRWKECPRCGFDVLESELIEEYTGKRVCKDCCDDPPEAKSASSQQ